MKDDDLKVRLRAVELSTPGIALDELMAEARRAAAPRPGHHGLLRMAGAVAVAWLLVLASQLTVERSIATLVPIPPVMQAGLEPGEGPAVAPTIIAGRELLMELLYDGVGPVEGDSANGADDGKGRGASGRRGKNEEAFEQCARRSEYV